MTAMHDLSLLTAEPFANALASLESLLVQRGRIFLLGAGCSKCAGLPLTAELTEQVLADTTLDADTRSVLTSVRTAFEGVPGHGIEDYLSEMVDHLAIAERRTRAGATQSKITIGNTTLDATQLRNSVEELKRAIVRIIQRPISVDTHRRFVRAVHRPLRPGTPELDHSVDYIVLNYDTVLESALALERVSFCDGVEGGATGWWNPATFDRLGVGARVYKPHGSIDWCQLPNDPLPRRVGERLSVDGANIRHVLIWPASTKYRETQLDPYAQVAERMRRCLPPGSARQCVLIICGYRFSDAHINAELDRALRHSHGNLTVVAFTSDDKPTGQLAEWHMTPAIQDQVLVFAKRGFFHGTVAEVTPHDLPWWNFEIMTRLIEGQR